MSEKALPISEIFTSLQGEGQWVGTPMLFVRLAGCNVGKPARALKVEEPFPLLITGREASACVTYDGRIFPCDTDYSLKSQLSIAELINSHLGTLKHVCVTGGEPFLHAELLERLFNQLNQLDVQMHVETSGTIIPDAIWKKLICPGYWITCAPKLNAQSRMIQRADELKLLVDQDFDVYKLTPEMREHRNVFLCPVNSVDPRGGNNEDNVKRCYDLVTSTFTNWRVSIQLHKNYGWR